MFIECLRKEFQVNEPIFTDEILEIFRDYTRAYVFRLIHKAKESGELVQFSKGIYYLPQKTVLGFSTITADDVVIKKYIRKNKSTIGVYSGLKLLNLFSITTQMPNMIEIVTNNETMRCRKIEIEGRKFILRKSRCRITSKNAAAYTVMQLFSDMKMNELLDENSKQKVIHFMEKNHVSLRQLVDLTNVFPAQTIKKMLINGMIYDIA